MKNKKYISLFLSIAFLLIVVNMINSDDVYELLTNKATFQNISTLIITIAIILFTRSIRWVLLIRAVNKSGFPLRSLFYYSFLSQFYNSFLFFGTGDVAKVLSIKFDKTQDRIFDIITMTIMDRILDIIIIVLGGFFALLVLEILEPHIFLILLGLGFSVAIVGTSFIYFLGWHKKVNKKWPTLKDQLELLWDIKRTIIFGLLLTTFVWTLEGVKIFQITNNFTVSEIGLFDAILIGLAAWLGTLVLIPVSGSLGSKEYLLSKSLKNQGVLQAESGLISVFDRLMTILISGLILLIFYFKNNSKTSDRKDLSENNNTITVIEK